MTLMLFTAAGLLAVLCLLGLVALSLALAVVVKRQNRTGERIADLTLRAEVSRATTAGPAPANTAFTGETERLAPWFSLPTLGGGTGSLASLLAAGRPIVLSFTDPRCGPCYELLPDIAEWQRVYGDRLTFALISDGAPALNRAMTAEYGIASNNIMLDADHAVSERFGTKSLPAAILIDPDGRIRTGTADGSFAVRSLVAGALGLALPPPSVKNRVASQAAQRGDEVPGIRRPDLDGHPIDFGALRGRPTTVLFWSPGCASCDELLPVMREWDATDGPMRLLVVTSGPAALNIEAGLRAPMVPDDDQQVRGLFGIEATPSAVVVDGRGVITTEVARGSRAVRRLGELAFDPASVRVAPGEPTFPVGFSAGIAKGAPSELRGKPR